VIVVQALANGRVKIGAEDLNLSKLGDRLSVILRTRAEKLVFVTADRDRPLEEVVQLIDIASYHAEHIALLPPLNVLRQPEHPICPKVIFKNWQVDAYRNDTDLPNWH